MNRKAVCAIASSLLIGMSGCVSGYKQFYQPAPGATLEAISRLRVGPPPISPIIERGQPGDNEAIYNRYAKRGYVAIGYSNFNSGRPESDEAAIRQGQDVGADLVLVLNPKYTGAVTSSIPLTTPTTSTSYSSGTATAYGPAGTVTAYGTGTTTTYGSTTTYIPFTIHRSDYGALYFVKQKFGLGTFTRDLTDSERHEFQTNKGAVVRLVVDDTPAFQADILVGDMIRSLDGIAVSGSKSFNELLRERAGKQVTLSILRRGQPVEKIIQLAR